MEDLPRLPPRSFCLIRHGETTANRDDIIAGRLDVALTEKGRAQAAALEKLQWKEPIALFCSPKTRAVETARLGFPAHVAKIVDGLEERDWGIYEGQTLAAMPPRGDTPKEGEAWRAMVLRVHRAICACCQTAPQRLPVLVCHSGVIRATRLLAGFGSVGERAPNAHPIFYRYHGHEHSEELETSSS